MNERADIFFFMLDKCYKIQAEKAINDMNVATYPHMLKKDASSTLDSYRRKTQDAGDLFIDDDDYSAIKDLKSNL